jgi:hypothetical protein
MAGPSPKGDNSSQYVFFLIVNLIQNILAKQLGTSTFMWNLLEGFLKESCRSKNHGLKKIGYEFNYCCVRQNILICLQIETNGMNL